LTLSIGGRVENYKFFGGVWNTNKGYEGVHSVAYIASENKGEFVCYNDTWVRTVKEQEIRGYAKLLFYCKDILI